MRTRRNDEFVVYVVSLSSLTRYVSIEFIGGFCGYVIGQKGLHSEIFGMVGSVAAPMLLRTVTYGPPTLLRRLASLRRVT
ncbi:MULTISPECIES: hypothetical protein [Paenibacillus]|uniref:MFS transporter n=2 Tax=Paenibacillus TaxID=44249 RepID=A0ABW9SU72_9BACL|nr:MULTISPECIES: hypothetical protein [Paenibacillus]MUG64524.1 hypothetical protein [Paenibacillus campinasensis]PAK55238.1 hypothetical protein CHH75_02980 [Paenibacillus sp. 7541]